MSKWHWVMKMKNNIMIYQYDIKNKRNCIQILQELQKDFPVYIREIQRIVNIILRFKNKNITIIAEAQYVDKQYRDSYYSYFSQKYSEYERNCLRLAFFEGKINQENFADIFFDLENIFIGTIVLRPLTVGNIGQTLLNPQKLNIKGYFRTCNFRVMIYGRKLNIEAFPYSSQDGETMSCAETALFNLIYYYGEKYSEYRVLMLSDILQEIERESAERVLPSDGLYEANIAKVLADAHFYPKIYSDQKGLEFILYTYIESGIPLLLNIPEHVVSCVGHGLVKNNLKNSWLRILSQKQTIKETDYYFLSTAQLCDEYIVMDDNEPPYYKTSLKHIIQRYGCTGEASEEQKLNEQISIIVPLYRRIFMDAARAENIMKSFFLENYIFLSEIRRAYDDKEWGSEGKNPFVWRMYLTASKSYKAFKVKNISNKMLKYFYMEYPFPRFIWILEIGTISEYRNSKARVEVLLDATSSPYSETRGILSVGYKDHFIFVPEIVKELLKNGIQKDIFLTKIFNMLYTLENNLFDETFETYTDSNLERNF